MIQRDKIIPPFEVQQAMVGIELDIADPAVIRYVNFLAEQFPIGAASFLHILSKPSLLDNLLDWEEETGKHPEEEQWEVMGKMQAALGNGSAASAIEKIELDAREGDPLKELLKSTTEKNPDLLVIGQKDAAGPHGILARNLIRKTNCNTLIIPDNAKPPIHRMLVPIDFSPSSVKALQIALAINRQLKNPAEIQCLHVYQTPSITAYRDKTEKDLKTLIEEDRRVAFYDFLSSYGVTEEDNVKTALLENIVGDVGTYIYEYAVKNGVDFIVIGAKGHSVVERLLLGSVTERLLMQNNLAPTLVVK